MAKPTTLDEDLDGALSYQERFKCADYIFSNSKKPLSECVKDCIVVLDTNVLLIPYVLKNEDVAEIESVYKKLADSGRLLLPKHVAREFAANKDKKLSELYKAVCDRNVSFLKLPDAAIIKGSPEFERLEGERAKLEAVAVGYNSAVKALAKSIKEWSWNDPVVQMYSRFFNGDTLVHHDKDDEYVKKELARRNEYKIAPGFKDLGKDSNSAGDLIVWLTILHVGREHKKDLIFVSEDRKPDWWTQANGSPFSPKFELINEYKEASSGKEISLLTFSEFLELFNAPKEVVKDVKRSEEEELSKRKAVFSSFNMSARENLVLEFLNRGGDVKACAYCGSPFDYSTGFPEVSHFVPAYENRESDSPNLLLVCRKCNSKNGVAGA